MSESLQYSVEFETVDGVVYRTSPLPLLEAQMYADAKRKRATVRRAELIGLPAKAARKADWLSRLKALLRRQ